MKKKHAVKTGKPPGDFEKPAADSRTLEEIIKTPTRDFIMKLSATADLAQYTSRLPDDEFGPERDATGEDYVTIRCYFHLLTARAMENRKFADYLVPILYKLGKRAVYDRRFYADLASILRFKYNYSFSILEGLALPTPEIRTKLEVLTPEDVEREVQKLVVNVNIDTIMEDWEKFAREIEKEPPRKEEPNLMYG